MKYSIAILTVIMLSGLFSPLSAQSFEEARNLAFNGERAKAREICKVILTQDYNSDVALLMGRTYAWDAKYDSARVVLKDILARNPNNMEALDALTDVEYWSEDYEKAIEYCDVALKINPKNEDFQLKKAKILHSNKQFEEASALLEALVKINGSNVEAMKKLADYRFDVLKNKVTINYTLDHFKSVNEDPWQTLTLSYGHKTIIGTVTTRVNYAQRFGSTGFQYEMDAYPKISENNYGYINYGFSQNTMFPKHRLGAELYHSFPNAFEGSLGMRTLFFSGSSVSIFTGSLGKYIGDYWISFRPYVTPGSEGTSVSGFLTTRRYFSDPANYLSLQLGYGISPDENQNLVNPDLSSKLNLKKCSMNLGYDHIIKRTWIINPSIGWSSEELQPGKFSSYYTFDISLTWLF
ncbi:YaiO family outer membrane beta-barrel protein [Solitalea sp. MAHUQ-68]|uniref:YaiO family outer membrane beta-barrel protein n=1 Tax=Solitalea agri TaxID=2953739 RepID=A0A9X2F5Q0_9SPHI|nr:YaiO family outer membrane beta-barrel protein [Solitalea agri]MCO4294620.1 YaiO family outer membrane beta-barrel protein [Solitalea agri]